MSVCTQGCMAQRGRRKKRDAENVFLLRAVALIINHNSSLSSPIPSYCPLPSHFHFSWLSTFLLFSFMNIPLIVTNEYHVVSFMNIMPFPLFFHSCYRFIFSCSFICFSGLHSSLRLSLNSPLSFCVSDMCIIAPSGWWLAMLTPLCLQGFIYTRIP